jgi:formylglycine-generating enzyme required for sulfatase activity
MVRINSGTVTNNNQAVMVGGFYMGKYEVTQTEYESVMGANPSFIKGPNLPVENVSWYDAVLYCNRRSQQEGLKPAYGISGTDINLDGAANGYRLPTGTEWEYACRAGTAGPFNTGYNITTSQANYNGNYPYNNNAKGNNRRSTMAVGSFLPNAWGLYDMHGNVWEWCWDRSGSKCVIRGGGWHSKADELRSDFIGSQDSDYHIGTSNRVFIGIRVVRPL